jgi:hypothetical protein
MNVIVAKINASKMSLEDVDVKRNVEKFLASLGGLEAKKFAQIAEGVRQLESIKETPTMPSSKPTTTATPAGRATVTPAGPQKMPWSEFQGRFTTLKNEFDDGKIDYIEAERCLEALFIEERNRRVARKEWLRKRREAKTKAAIASAKGASCRRFERRIAMPHRGKRDYEEALMREYMSEPEEAEHRPKAKVSLASLSWQNRDVAFWDDQAAFDEACTAAKAETAARRRAAGGARRRRAARPPGATAGAKTRPAPPAAATKRCNLTPRSEPRLHERLRAIQ